MRIFIGADHRGFELKDQLIDYLHEKDIRIEDLGNYEYDENDDYPDFAKKVAIAVLQDIENSLGILICGSGNGVTIAANRFKKIRCGLGFEKDQVKHIKEKDHINILALPADYIDFEKAKVLVDTFLETRNTNEQKYLNRIKKVDEIDLHHD
jgi:ribose 5-phosphate isomerase B